MQPKTERSTWCLNRLTEREATQMDILHQNTAWTEEAYMASISQRQTEVDPYRTVHHQYETRQNATSKARPPGVSTPRTLIPTLEGSAQAAHADP